MGINFICSLIYGWDIYIYLYTYVNIYIYNIYLWLERCGYFFQDVLKQLYFVILKGMCFVVCCLLKVEKNP